MFPLATEDWSIFATRLSSRSFHPWDLKGRVGFGAGFVRGEEGIMISGWVRRRFESPTVWKNIFVLPVFWILRVCLSRSWLLRVGGDELRIFRVDECFWFPEGVCGRCQCSAEVRHSEAGPNFDFRSSHVCGTCHVDV
ncbi:hypothetical protein MFRU_005g01500 [Monilinia fructicola]|nr:hypothetical protein MFRU_005g01500 [Monilinia fructicola]